jgi:hypothetical protein
MKTTGPAATKVAPAQSTMKHTGCRVLSRTALVYDAGADAKSDRPAHVRAGSGCCFVDIPGQGRRLAVVQDDAAFVALVRVTEHWVVFTINPFIKAPDSGFGPVALKLLACANQQASLVKLGLDDDGDAFINVELPSEGFGYPQFAAGLTGLTHSADTLLLPILQAGVVDERNVA